MAQSEIYNSYRHYYTWLTLEPVFVVVLLLCHCHVIVPWHDLIWYAMRPEVF